MKQNDVCVTGAARVDTEGLPSSVSPTSSESRADSSVVTVVSAASYLLTQRQHKGHRNVIPPDHQKHHLHFYFRVRRPGFEHQLRLLPNE